MDKAATTTRDWVATARTLSEALPNLQAYDGAIVVIKLGGNAMKDDATLRRFARDVVLMKQCNVNPVIVHGGGPKINELLGKLDIDFEFVEGKRVTTPEVMEVVEMALAGSVNKKIVQAITDQGGRAVGICGKDGKLMVCERDVGRVMRDGEEVEVDLGLVGRPVAVNPGVLRAFLGSDFIPVVAPIGMGEHGETYNVNGDTAAGAIAAAMEANRLLLLTDVPGVKDGDGQVVSRLTAPEVEELRKSGVIQGGMLPKTRTALDAIDAGVGAVVILNGTTPHAVLLELFTAHGAGTLIEGQVDASVT